MMPLPWLNPLFAPPPDEDTHRRHYRRPAVPTWEAMHGKPMEPDDVVLHNGLVWTLTVPLADAALSEPDGGTDWA